MATNATNAEQAQGLIDRLVRQTVTRPQFEHIRDVLHGPHQRFDRSLFVPALYEGHRKDGTVVHHGTFRLRILNTLEDGQTTISDEDTTSEAVNAQAVDGKSTEIILTEDQIRWVHRQLGELIARQDSLTRKEEDE